MKHTLHKVWRVARYPLLVLAVAYVGLVIYRIPAVGEKQKTVETVAYIQAQKITLSDVTGSALPPVPNVEKNNSTLEGIDLNNNGIRDDVELAIFALHPDSARIRAAELQYAMALQLELTKVFNSETLVAAIQQEAQGGGCISDTVPLLSKTHTSEDAKKAFALSNARAKEVEASVLNTSSRRDYREGIYKKYMTSYKLEESENCDISLNSLPS